MVLKPCLLVVFLAGLRSCESAGRKRAAKSHFTIENNKLHVISDEEEPGESIVTQSAKSSQVMSPVLKLFPHIFAGNVLDESNHHAENWIVFFGPRWYSEARHLFTLYEEMAGVVQGHFNDDLMSLQVRFGFVDCASHKVLCNQQDVEEYPTVVHYRRGQRKSTWKPQTKKPAEHFAAWLKDAIRDIPPASLKATEVSAPKTGAQVMPSSLPQDLLMIGLVMAFNCWAFLSGARPEPSKASMPSSSPHAGPVAAPSETEAVSGPRCRSTEMCNSRSKPATGVQRYLPSEWRSSGRGLDL